jgi:hypothetical protein
MILSRIFLKPQFLVTGVDPFVRTLDAQGYPLRMSASQFSQRSEDIRIPELEAGSAANQKIYDSRDKFNQNIDVFSGGGDGWGKLGDQVVMPNSAFGLKFFANPERFHSKLYPKDTHGQLHEGEEEIQDTMKFLKYGEIPHAKK